jgi:hypothetical protein
MRRSFPDQASSIGAGVRCVAVAMLLAAAISCGGGGGSPTETAQPADTAPRLEPDEINAIMQLASRAIGSELVVAVTDRQARILGVATNFPIDADSCKAAACSSDGQQCGAPVCSAVSSDCATVALATQLARTAGLFSADQIFLTSRRACATPVRAACSASRRPTVAAGSTRTTPSRPTSTPASSIRRS